jgi:hypothetical protein
MVSGNRRAGLAEEILSEVFRLYAETPGRILVLPGKI